MAEDVYLHLPPAEREAAHRIFLRLITLDQDGNLRPRTASWDELTEGGSPEEGAVAERVLAAFAQVISRTDGQVALSWPALPYAWPRLRA